LWLARLAGPVRFRLLLAAGAGALATGCGIALLATSGFLLARASQHPDIVALSVAIVAVRGLSIGRGVLRYAERLAAHDAAFRILARVRVLIWRRLAVLAPAGLSEFRSGDLLARLVSDVDATQDLFIRGLAPPMAAALAGSGAVLACLLILPPAGLALAAGMLAAGVVVPWVSLRAARTAAQRAAPARGQLAASVADLLDGAPDLIAFGATDLAIERARAASRDLTAVARRSSVAASLGSGLGNLAAGLTLWIVLLLGVQAAGSGALGRVPFAVVTLTAFAAFEAVTALPAAAVALSQAKVSAGRVASVCQAPDPVTEPRVPRRLPAAPFAVRLRQAEVRYEPDGPLAIDGVSLDLTPGRRVALAGPNGAGKSTVASVLLRFQDLTGGLATLGGHDLASYRADDIRVAIGGCPQDQHLFDATIAGNLRLARPTASDDDLRTALAEVGLSDWLGTLPDGLRTQVGPHGAAVSGGQRQRLFLARALLADPAVLVLDEPTAHLDADARRSFTRDLLAVTRGRSTLWITHDLSGLDQVDEIIVLDHGRVAGRGTHQQLLAASETYQRLWQSAGR
jgi:thiol reductant ABC exporter CydC subunit